MGDVIVATGLRREAACFRAIPGVTVIAGGGDPRLLRERLKIAAGDSCGIVSFGMAGALSDQLAVGDWVVADRVVGLMERHCHPVWRDRFLAALPGARVGAIQSDGRLIGSAAEKRAIGAAHGALAIDMESCVAASVAAAHGIPLATIRCISDTVDDDLPPLIGVAMAADGRLDMAAMAGSLARAPVQFTVLLPALIRFAGAMRALQRGGRRIVPVLRESVSR